MEIISNFQRSHDVCYKRELNAVNINAEYYVYIKKFGDAQA